MTNAESTLRAHLREHPLDTGAHLALADAIADAGDERAAILYRIVHDPGNGDWRLQYASLLERETPARVTCPKCKGTQWVPERDVASGRHEGGRTNCKRCTGGEVIDTDRAEYIRCQIELAKYPVEKIGWRFLADGSSVDAESRAVSDENPARERLQRRQSELLARHCTRWLPVCPQCQGSGKQPCPSAPSHMQQCDCCWGKKYAGDMHRGFLHSVEVPTLEAVLEKKNVAADDEFNDGWHPTDFARTLFRGEFATVQAVVVNELQPELPAECGYTWHYDERLPLTVRERIERANHGLWDFGDPNVAKVFCWTALCDTLRALCEGET